MIHLLGLIAALLVLGFLIWLFSGTGNAKKNSALLPDEVLDASDSRQIGFLIGLSGGSISDAAVAQYALQRFEKTYGRKAKARDLGMILSLIHQNSAGG